MLIAVLILNLLLAMLCWWAIWQVLQLRQALAELTERLSWAESQAQQLQTLPRAAIQQRLQNLRSQYQQILLRLQQAQQMLSLIGLGQVLWQQLFRRQPQQPRFNRPSQRRN
jgi:F0F1-type ATP synthase membrane subunit b/b'